MMSAALVSSRRQPNQLPQPLIDQLFVEQFGVKVSTDPFSQFLIFLTLGICYRAQFVYIAPWAAAVFRRACACSIDTNRTGKRSIVDDSFYDQRMIPVVCGVVQVVKYAAQSNDFAQSGFALVPRIIEVVPVRRRVSLSLDREVV